MFQLKTKFYSVLTLGFVMSTSVFANGDDASASERDAEVRAKFILGIEADSNVAVEAIDSVSAEGDSLWTFSANLDYRKKLNQSTDLKIGSSHSQNRHDEFSEFDLTTNFVTADLSHDFGNFSSGAIVSYIAADLDSQNFLTLSQASLYVNKLLNSRVFLRADYTYSDKQFETLTDRDATQHSGSADLYFFLDGSKRYWVTGYKYEDEDAISDQFDREVHSFNLRYKQTFSLFGRSVVARAKARYQIRDYSGITPSIGAVRDEERVRLGAELEIPLTDSWFALIEYERSDYDSNLPSADYSQNIFALKIGWESKR